MTRLRQDGWLLVWMDVDPGDILERLEVMKVNWMKMIMIIMMIIKMMMIMMIGQQTCSTPPPFSIPPWSSQPEV